MSALGFGTLANKRRPFYSTGGGGGGGGVPSAAPTVPGVSGAPTSSSITVIFDTAGITGTAPLEYSILYGTTTSPTTSQPAILVSGTVYRAVVIGLTESTQYYFKSVVTNSAGSKTSAVSVGISTAAAGPNAPSAAPTVPVLPPGAPPVTSLTVVFNTTGITGTPTPTYSLLYGRTNIITPLAAVSAGDGYYVATITGLFPETTYFFRSVASNSSGTKLSEVSIPFTTSLPPLVPPNAPPSVPVVFGAPTTTQIQVQFNTAGVLFGTPTPTFYVLYGTTNPPLIPLQAVVQAGSIYQATATNLTPGTTYYFASVSTNGVTIVSGINSIDTAGGGPVLASLKTNVVLPFLLQGPRFGATPGAWDGLDYYVSSNATGAVYAVNGTTATGTQLYGSMYAGTVGAPGNASNDPADPVPWAGACVADQPFSTNYSTVSDGYLSGLRNTMDTNGRVLACWGGFYADVRGLFGPYTAAGYPGTPPTAQQVVQSFLYNYCGIITGNTNPLNWKRQNSNNTSSYSFYFDGLILDFENVGNGNPINSFPYAPPGSPPVFPASATDPAYAPYIAEIGNIPSQYYAISPTLFLGNAPVSLSIAADVGATNITAANTALNTWFPFATATTPPTGTSGANPYNSAASLALNHPVQLSYMDDIFVQFYNEGPDYYPGGQYFANLLACWGYVALEAQKLGRKNTTINLGLAKGNIIPGGPPPFTADTQGPTPPLPGQTPPYTLWYPQYCTASPPNATTANPSGLFWPNTSPTADPQNIATAITAANTILRTATGNANLAISDWLSGMGFWAAENATLMAKAVYDDTNAFSPASLGNTDVLPHGQVYCWGDASYPAPDPKWAANVPIVCTWDQ